MRNLLIIFLFFSTLASAQNSSELFEQGKTKFKNGEFREAIKIFTKVVNESTYYYEAYVLRGRCYAEFNKLDSAIADFNMALEKKSDYLPAKFYRGEVYFNQKKYDLATTDFQTIVTAKPKYSKAWVYLALISEEKQEFKKSIEQYTSAVNLGAADYEIYYRRGKLYLKMRMQISALYDFSESIRLKADFYETYFLRAIIYIEDKKYTEAVADLDMTIKLKPDFEEAYMKRGDAQFALNNFKQATEDYTILITKYKRKSADVYIKRGTIALLDSNISLAHKDFERALQMDPRNDTVSLCMAKTSMKKKDYNTAMVELRKTLAYNDKNWEAYFLRAKILYERERFDEALPDLNSCLILHDHADAFFYRGSILFMKQDFVGACTDLNKAKKLGYTQNDIDKSIKRVCGMVK